MQAHKPRVRLALLVSMARMAHKQGAEHARALRRYQATRAGLSAALAQVGTPGDKALAAKECPLEPDVYPLSAQELEKKTAWMMEALCVLSFETPMGEDTKYFGNA